MAAHRPSKFVQISTGTENGAGEIVEVTVRVEGSVRGRKFVVVLVLVCASVSVC